MLIIDEARELTDKGVMGRFADLQDIMYEIDSALGNSPGTSLGWVQAQGSTSRAILENVLSPLQDALNRTRSELPGNFTDHFGALGRLLRGREAADAAQEARLRNFLAGKSGTFRQIARQAVADFRTYMAQLVQQVADMTLAGMASSDRALPRPWKSVDSANLILKLFLTAE